MSRLEVWAAFSVPGVVGVVALLLLTRRRVTFDSFVTGAREGLACAVGLLPSLVAILVGIRMLEASGLLEALQTLLAPAAEKIGVPAALVPLLLTRPFSGSASTAAYAALMAQEGPDSLASLCASVIMGSSDTLVYVIGVYFSSVGVKRSRYAFPCAIAVMLFGVFFACLLCRLFFGGGL